MSLRSRSAAPIIVRFIDEATKRHGGHQWVSTPSLLRKGSGNRPAFTVVPRRQILACCQARRQPNSQRTVALDRRWDQLNRLPDLGHVRHDESDRLGCSDSSLSARELAYCFLRLGNLDSGAFERLGRYNAALWKQAPQTLFLLGPIRRC
jgi:hypothetical protein